MKKLVHQHGDLILEVVNKIPASAKLVKDFDGIVLKGEGVNTHTLNPKNVVTYMDHDGTLYFRIKKETELNHQEHGKQVVKTLEKEKVYKRVIEREWNAEQEEARQTRD